MPDQFIDSTNDSVDRRVAAVEVGVPLRPKPPPCYTKALAHRSKPFVDVKSIDHLDVEREARPFAKDLDEIPEFRRTVLHHRRWQRSVSSVEMPKLATDPFD